MTHIPQNKDCMDCIHLLRNCEKLDFTKMRVVKVYSDGVKAVECEGRK